MCDSGDAEIAASYQIRPEVQIDVSSGATTSRYMLQIVDAETEEPMAGLGTEVISGAGEVNLQGPPVDTEAELPFCYTVLLTDILTGESESVVEDCFDESDVKGTAPDEEPGMAPDECQPGTFVEIIRGEDEVPIDGPDAGTVNRDGERGCSAAGTSVASWLLLLVAALFAVRRAVGRNLERWLKPAH